MVSPSEKRSHISRGDVAAELLAAQERIRELEARIVRDLLAELTPRCPTFTVDIIPLINRARAALK
jgi:hypothetical protein